MSVIDSTACRAASTVCCAETIWLWPASTVFCASTTSLPATAPGVADAAFSLSNVLASPSAFARAIASCASAPCSRDWASARCARSSGASMSISGSPVADARSAIDANRLHEARHLRVHVHRFVRLELGGQIQRDAGGLLDHADCLEHRRTSRPGPLGRRGWPATAARGQEQRDDPIGQRVNIMRVPARNGRYPDRRGRARPTPRRRTAARTSRRTAG